MSREYTICKRCHSPYDTIQNKCMGCGYVKTRKETAEEKFCKTKNILLFPVSFLGRRKDFCAKTILILTTAFSCLCLIVSITDKAYNGGYIVFWEKIRYLFVALWNKPINGLIYRVYAVFPAALQKIGNGIIYRVWPGLIIAFWKVCNGLLYRVFPVFSKWHIR